MIVNKIVITQWAFDSYLDLKHEEIFIDGYFRETIKPDVMFLLDYPNAAKFDNNKFWSPVSYNGNIIANGFKMKWHQVGNGRVQLRLPVAIMKNIYLCGAYVKKNEKTEKRMLAKFKTHLQLIKEGNYIKCGELS